MITDQSPYGEGSDLADEPAGKDILRKKDRFLTGKIKSIYNKIKGDTEYADGTTDGL
jgi:hypothetical protein